MDKEYHGITRKIVKKILQQPKNRCYNCSNYFGNCAEVDSVNQALNNGANMSDLYMYTINVNIGVAKGMCENCIYTFSGNVADVLSK